MCTIIKTFLIYFLCFYTFGHNKLVLQQSGTQIIKILLIMGISNVELHVIFVILSL